MNYCAQSHRHVMTVLASICCDVGEYGERGLSSVRVFFMELIGHLGVIGVAISLLVCVAAGAAQAEEKIEVLDLEGSGAMLMMGGGSMIMLPWRNVTLDELSAPLQQELDSSAIETWRFLLLTEYAESDPESPSGDEPFH